MRQLGWRKQGLIAGLILLVLAMGLGVAFGQQKATPSDQAREKVWAMAKTQDVQGLIAALKEPDGGVRSTAAWVLGVIAPQVKDAAALKPAIPALGEALECPRASSRAAWALRRIAGRVDDDLALKAVIPPLKEMLKDRDAGTRVGAAETLAVIATKVGDALDAQLATQTLIKGLNAENPNVRVGAALALGQVSKAPDFATLDEMLNLWGYSKTAIEKPLLVELLQAEANPCVSVLCKAGGADVGLGWYQSGKDYVLIEKITSPAAPIAIQPDKGPFGLYIAVGYQGQTYKWSTEPTKNNGEAHAKAFPIIRDGVQVPGSYLLCWEDLPITDAANVDYQDIVVRVDGMTPVAIKPFP